MYTDFGNQGVTKAGQRYLNTYIPTIIPRTGMLSQSMWGSLRLAPNYCTAGKFGEEKMVTCTCIGKIGELPINRQNFSTQNFRLSD